jgi:hypothetical protein
MKRFLLSMAVLSTLLVGCGAINEPEAPVPVVKVEAKPAACSFPKKFDSQANVLTGIDCLKMNLDNAFDSLVGKTDNELSMVELKKLQEEHLLEFAVNDPKQWDGISGLLSLVHPQGRNAISRVEIHRFLDWLRTHAEYLAKLNHLEKYKGIKAPYQYPFFSESMAFADELLNFLSDQGSLSLEQAQALVALGDINRPQDVKSAELTPKLNAAWTLKALAMESTRAIDNVRGASLKTLIRVGIQAARQIDKTYQWWETDFHPAKTPDAIEKEWQGVLELAKNYFRTTPMFDIDTDEMRAQVRVLFPTSDFPDRIPDLVKASRKLLARAGDTHPGLVYGLLHMFEGTDVAARSIRESSPMFLRCADTAACSIPMRHALDYPLLKSVALVSAKDWAFNPASFKRAGAKMKAPLRQSGALEWKAVLNRFIEKSVMGNIFAAFDHNGDSFIAYTGETQEDIREATDVAYNIIGILSSAKRADGETAPVYVKPSTVIGAIGLIADKWVLQGNSDGKIDANEFYAALKLYEDVSFISQHSALSLQLLSRDKATAMRNFTPTSDPLYVLRSVFMKNMGTTYERDLPYLINVFTELNSHGNGADSLMDLIVPKHTETFELFANNGSSLVSRGDYIDRADMFAPVSILVLLDRLIVKCDANEDELFNWDELDCVMPLALNAGKQIFGSGLFEMPLFVTDSAKLTLDLLSQKGLPALVGKLFVLNGSTRQMNLGPAWVEFAKKQMKGNAADIIRLFETVSPLKESQRADIRWGVTWSMSVRGLFGGNGDDVTNGVKGWDSLTSNLIDTGVLPTLAEKSYGLITEATVKAQWEAWDTDPKFYKVRAIKPLLPLVFVLGARPADTHKVFNETVGSGLGMDPISPSKILSLLEGLLAPTP